MTTVLVVDDRAANREVARDMLDSGGYLVIEASNGRQALSLAKSRHPDIILSDVLMPGMDGYQFAYKLRADPDTADIPMLFFSANYRQGEAGDLGSAVGISKILDKSATQPELLAAIAQTLHERLAPLIGAADFEDQHAAALNAKLFEKIGDLDASEARFAAMAEACPVGIVLADRHGRATYVNPQLTTITGQPAEDLLGNGWLRCLGRDLQITARQVVTGPAETDFRHSPQLLLPDGGSRRLSLITRPIVGRTGIAGGSVTMIDDITDVVEAEERQRAAELERERKDRLQAIARFDSLARVAGGVAHDFNNLLNVILSYADFVKESVLEAAGTTLSAEEAAAITADVSKIHHAGTRAAHLTHQLLTFGGKKAINAVPVDVNAIVTEAYEQIKGQDFAAVSVELHLAPGPLRACGDPDQLREAVVNLGVNSGEAMPTGGTLVLATADALNPGAGLRDGNYIRITVTDTGCGMTPEVAHQATEPFFTTKPRGTGQGLGLAAAYGVLRQAGGALLIDSVPGEGTSVHALVPATDSPPTPDPAVVADAPGHGQTILVAEDEDDLREMLARILGRAGFTVLTSANGQDALATAERYDGPVHLLLSDVIMPVMNGPDLAEALHRVRPGTPVLFMSGYAAPLMSEQGLLDADVAVVTKPFKKEDLLAAVRSALAVRV